MARRMATAVFALGCMHASVVSALGLGELKLDSFLNEPLSASVNLLNTRGLHEDQIRVRLATSDDFEKLGVDRVYFLTSIEFEISIDEQGNGSIILSSEDPVLEPYLDFIIEARWPTGRLLREYTVLVDSPSFSNASPLVSATARVAEVEGDSQETKKKTESEASSSGTQVETQRSDLADGQMPARDFGSSASAAPLAGNQYMIRRDETLWGIAARSKPEGTSVHQTMLDIQRLNPNAFINGNINRIKAGYIIYLPSSGDISSDNLEMAKEEVRQQNQDWRNGVERERDSSGPSLRISAEPQTEQATVDSASGPVISSGSDESSPLADADGDDVANLSQRLSALEAQLETMQRIATLKDDQIAALQSALSESEAAAEQSADLNAQMQESVDKVDEPPVKSALDLAREAASAKAAAQKDVEPVAQTPVPAAAPTVVAPRAPAPVQEESSNILSYIIGSLVLIGLAVFFFLRRRNEDTDQATTEPAKADVFADVKLQDSDVDLETAQPAAKPEAAPDSAELTETQFGPVDGAVAPPVDPTPEPRESETQAKQDADSRGYGERKHDEYASDEAGDALAEADIYIAYGRFPQAVNLLKTAISNEPRNPDYRLKLIELCMEMGNKDEAEEQLAELKAIGDANSLARAEDILQNSNGDKELPGSSVAALSEAMPPPVDDVAEQLNGLDLTTDTGAELEADFGELEIELSESGALDDDLDLSADFTNPDPVELDTEEEDLVFAEGGDEMSTKLDLARAYLDMGDEDGAKQILDEVAGQGNEEQKEEARVLLEQLD